MADYDRAIALDPGFALAYNNRGAAYGKKGDLDCAIADYQQALRVNPQFDQAAQNLADAREERDRRLAAGGDSPVLRLSIAAPRISRSRKRSVPIPIWRGSTARSGQFTRRRS
ncbi:MAG: tetratricopeptide repeat protein [Xanthobacteraceae bacterium]